MRVPARYSALPLAAMLIPLPGLAAAEVPGVVTDMPVIQSLAAQVMGDLGTPQVLLDRGANVHSYQMKPSQARALEQADLLIWVGPELTPWLARAADSAAPVAQIVLLQTPGTARQDFADTAAHDHEGEQAGEDHHDEHGDEHAGAGEGHEDHDHEGLDPHAWLDPHNAGVWLAAIAAELSRLDPEHGAAYAANATAARDRIAALDAELKADLAPVAERPFVVFHAAYGYFTAHYGLHDAGSVAFGDATDPGAAHLAGLRAGLAEDGIVCAFPEAGHDPRPIERLIEGTPVRLGAPLDPEGAQLDTGAGLYEALLRGLARDLRECLAP